MQTAEASRKRFEKQREVFLRAGSVVFRELLRQKNNVVRIARVRGVSSTVATELTRQDTLVDVHGSEIRFKQHGTTLTESFPFHYALDKDVDNEELFALLSPLFSAGIQRQDVLVVADGASNSGKSWTMLEGKSAIASELTDFIWRDIENVRERIQRREHEYPSAGMPVPRSTRELHRDYRVVLQAVEIYNGDAIDLLSQIRRPQEVAFYDNNTNYVPDLVTLHL